jgi:hypothetical protein
LRPFMKSIFGIVTSADRSVNGKPAPGLDMCAVWVE